MHADTVARGICFLLCLVKQTVAALMLVKQRRAMPFGAVSYGVCECRPSGERVRFEGLTGQVRDSLLCLHLSMHTTVQLCPRWALRHTE